MMHLPRAYCSARVRSACAIAALAAIVCADGAAQPAPRLPAVALETFPAAARDVIATAYREAAARPADAAAVGALGRALQAWEQWDAAHQAYAAAQSIAPRAFEWQYLDGVVLQRLARHEEAAARLKAAVTLQRDYLPARVKLAESLLDAGALGESRTLFQALANEPDAAAAAEVGLGRIAAAEARHEDAVRHFERALAAYPELGAAHYAIARSYRALGRTDEAARALQKHAQFGARWPRLPDPVLDAVAAVREDPRAMLQRGVALGERGELPAAIAAHEAALARDRSFVQAHINLISLYGRTRDWAKAEEHYRAYDRLGARSADAEYDYGVVLGLQARWDDAAAAYRRAIVLNPLHAQARNNLGQTLEQRRDFAAAAAEYRQAVEAQPSFRLARFNLGRMLLALGQSQEALVELDKLQQPRDAEAPRYLFALSVAHVRVGKTDEGLKFALEARTLAESFGQAELVASIDRELARLK